MIMDLQRYIKVSSCRYPASTPLYKHFIHRFVHNLHFHHGMNETTNKPSGCLLQKKQHCFSMPECIKAVHRKSCFSSKTVIWLLVLYCVIESSTTLLYHSTTLLYYGNTRLLASQGQQTVLECVLSGMYILFPILAYLGECFNRYRIMSGVAVTMLSYLLYILLLIVQAVTGDGGESNFFSYAYIVLVVPAVCGKGLYITNIPQFGASQLQFASSEHLAAFARWIAFTFFLSQLLVDVAVAVLVLVVEYGYQCISVIIIIHGLYFSLLILSLMIVYRLRHTLIVDPPPMIDGLRLIWRVMKYSWKHKYPVRRSAFTYSENSPTRLDLAKERYGGPFTTKQVEEVKSFWHLILIPICHFLNTGYLFSTVLLYQYTNCQDASGMEQSFYMNMLESVLLVNSAILKGAVSVISLIIFQLMIVVACSKFVPNILQRIWIGLFLLLLSSLSVMVISFNVTGNLLPPSSESSGSSSFNTCDENLWPLYVFIVPRFLTGLAQVFNLTSQLEFIFAQAPHNMQSIFVGAMYAQVFFPYLCNAVGNITVAGKHWQFYVSLSCLQLFILVVFTIIKRRYKYRQCNNDSDINIRMNIEDVYERDLDARDLHAALKESDECNYQSIRTPLMT